MLSSGIKGGAAGPNTSRCVINVQDAYMNKAKGINPSWPASVTLDSSGYPTSAPASNQNTNPQWFPNYTGDIVMKCGGAAPIGLYHPLIISSGGKYISGVTPANIGDTNGGGSEGSKFFNNGLDPSPRVVFKVGYNIVNLSQSPTNNGAGGNLIRLTTKTGYVGNGFASNSTPITITGQAGQAAATGTWLGNKIDGQTIDLLGTTWNVADPYVSGGQALLSQSLATLAFLSSGSGTYSGFTNFVICKAAHEPDVDSGLYWDPDYVAQLVDLNANGNGPAYTGILRFMDLSACQGSFESYSALRRLPADASWGQIAQGIQVGSITNGGSDNYTCSNPSNSPASGAPSDGEVLSGLITVSNSGYSPTLGITGRAGTTFPIILGNSLFPHNICPRFAIITGGAASAGQTMTFTFQASWFNGGATYTFNYVTVSGDVGSANTLATNLANALSADSTLGPSLTGIGGAFVGTGTTPPSVGFKPPTPLAGTLTINYTSGPAVVTFGTLDQTSLLPTSGYSVFVFSKLLQAWMYIGQSYDRSVPIEVIIELCNRTKMHCFYNWPIISTSAYVSAITTLFARAQASGGLMSGLKFMTETINEVWNFSANPSHLLDMFGRALGWSGSGNTQLHGYNAIRAMQYATATKAAWTGQGRAATDHLILQMSQLGESVLTGGWEAAALAGSAFVTTNTFYANYAGLNGTAESNRNTVGNRPGTSTDAIGSASYMNSRWLGKGSFTNSSQFDGTIASNGPVLQAAKDFMNGNTSTAFAALVNQFTRVVDRGASHGAYDFVDAKAEFVRKEAIAAKYDAERIAASLPVQMIIDYEGGMAFGIGNDGNSGVNSLGLNIASADITALSTQIGGLGDVSAYTISGTNDPTEMATMLLKVLQGWKYDIDKNSAAANTGSYKNMIKSNLYLAKRTTHYPRECHPAQYGYQASNWAVFATSFQDSTSRYQSYDAIKEFNSDVEIS